MKQEGIDHESRGSMDLTDNSAARPATLTEVEYRVLRYIRQNPGRSRTEIASALGLSKSMLTKAVSNFHEMNLVIEQQVSLDNGERGKPPVMLSLREDAFHSIGVYVNRQICAVVRADLHGKLIYKSVKTLPEPAVSDILAEVSLAVTASSAPLLGIGHAVPAIISDNGELFEVTPTQATLPFADIATGLRQRFGLPLFWENDAFCAAAYEANTAYAAKQCVFYVGFGFGVGGGLTTKGSLFRGAYNQAANIGGLIPETGPRPSLTDLAGFLGRPLTACSEDYLRDLFSRKDQALLQWIDDRAPRLSEPLSAAVQFFNPDAIVIGGFLPSEILEAICAKVTLDVHDVAGRRALTKPALTISTLLGPVGTAEAASFLPVSSLLLGQNAYCGGDKFQPL